MSKIRTRIILDDFFGILAQINILISNKNQCKIFHIFKSIMCLTFNFNFLFNRNKYTFHIPSFQNFPFQL